MPKTNAAAKLERIEPEVLGPRVTDGAPLRRPIRVGIISNPGSGQNLRHGLQGHIEEALKAHPQVVHLGARSLEEIQAAARQLVEGDSEVIVVNGGDGTVQAVLTAMFEAPIDRLPVLAVLAGGTTNSTAHNVGFGKRPLAAVQRLLAATAQGSLPGKVETCPVMRADVAGGTQYAMMFAVGAVYSGIVFYREHIESRGLRGELGAGVAVATFVGRVLSGGGAKIFPPLSVEVSLDGQAIDTQVYLGMIISTISRQILGITPYWGSGPGPVRYTSIRTEPKKMLRAVVPALRGRDNPLLRPENGYHSANADEVRLRFTGGYTLDGELFPPADGPTEVTLSARQCAYFLRDK